MNLEFPVAVTFQRTSATRHTLECNLRYSSADPYAVHLCFPRPDADSQQIIWTFSRELLTQGLTRHTGLGDVRVHPLGSSRTHISLLSANATAELSLRTAQVRAFLALTEEAVACGAEADLVDWDRLAQQLSSHIP